MRYDAHLQDKTRRRGMLQLQLQLLPKTLVLQSKRGWAKRSQIA